MLDLFIFTEISYFRRNLALVCVSFSKSTDDLAIDSGFILMFDSGRARMGLLKFSIFQV